MIKHNYKGFIFKIGAGINRCVRHDENMVTLTDCYPYPGGSDKHIVSYVERTFIDRNYDVIGLTIEAIFDFCARNNLFVKINAKNRANGDVEFVILVEDGLSGDRIFNELYLFDGDVCDNSYLESTALYIRLGKAYRACVDYLNSKNDDKK